MERFHQYLISVTAASIVCAIAKTVCDEKTAAGSLIRLTSGIVMTLTVLTPLLSVDISRLPELSDDWSAAASAAVAEGEQLAGERINVIITDRVSAYILDKANDFGAKLEVDVLMPDDGSHQPEGMVLYGEISPYAKSRLQQIIEEEFLIPKEDQQWIS